MTASRFSILLSKPTPKILFYDFKYIEQNAKLHHDVTAVEWGGGGCTQDWTMQMSQSFVFTGLHKKLIYRPWQLIP